MGLLCFTSSFVNSHIFFLQGILPQNFKKVEQPELKEIIGICISSTKEDRPTVKDLLQFEFFQEDLGLKVEFVNKEESIQNTSSKVELWLRLLDPKKRKEKHKENEAIQFEFDIETDNCDEVAQAMVIYCYVLYFFSLFERSSDYYVS